MKKKFLALFLCLSLLATLIACAPKDSTTAKNTETAATSAPVADVDGMIVNDTGYTLSKLTQDSNLYGGPNGCAFDNEDKLYVGSVAGVSMFQVDKETGDASVYLGSPYGGADDIVFAPDGTMYWTAFFLGQVFKMDTEGKITLLADQFAGANSLDLDADGNLYCTQVFFGDALWKIDTTGGRNNVKIAEGLGGLNGFEIGKDGYIYGPLWFKQQVAKIDPATGEIVKIVADGFVTPCAVNFDSQGNLWALDTGTGEIFKINVDTGEKELIATQAPHLDNLCIDSKDRIFFTNMNTSGVYELDTATAEIRTVTEDITVYPQGIEVISDGAEDTLYFADNFAYKKLAVATKEVECPENGSTYCYTASLSEDGTRIVMTGWNDGSIKIFDTATDQMERYTGFAAPAGAVLLSDGSVLALESVKGNLVRISGYDAATAQVIASGLEGPAYLVLAGSDDPSVYVTEYSAGKITKINYETGAQTVICNMLSGPEGIALTANGKLLVIDSAAKQLLSIKPDTGEKTVLIDNLPSGHLGASSLGPEASPLEDVAVSANGNIYFTSPQNNAIYMLAKN